MTHEYVLLEEHQEPVQMHWVEEGKRRLLPHFKRACPYCVNGPLDIKPMWYVGGFYLAKKEFVIVELNEPCFRIADASARRMEVQDGQDLYGQPTYRASFVGLKVKIIRQNFDGSPRVLRCDERVSNVPEWKYETRYELARSLDIATRPRLYREGGANA